MKFVTVATQVKGYMPVLLQSFRRHGIQLDVIGMGETWGGFGWKILKLLEYLNRQDPQELVVCMDAYDVILLNPDTIQSRFESHGKKILLSNEAPINTLWHRYLYGRVFPSFEVEGKKFNVNAGLYMGHASYLKQLIGFLSKLDNLNDKRCDDQVILNRFCKENKSFFDKFVSIDTDRVVFHNVFPDNLLSRRTSTRPDRGRLRNHQKREVNIVHGPGNTDMDFIIRSYQLDNSQELRTGYKLNGIKLYLPYIIEEIVAIVICVVLVVVLVCIKKRSNRFPRST